jgi:hypothetical protein
MQKTTKIILALAGVGGLLYLLSKSKKGNGFKDKELGKLVEDLKQMPDLEKAITEQSWVVKRPTYENAVFEDLETYLATNPNGHLIRKGWMRDVYALDRDVKELTKEEFEKAQLILVDGKVMLKDYYIDYILKPQPTQIGEAVQKSLDEQLGLVSIPVKEVVRVPVVSPNDPLKAVVSAEVISKYDPDRVLERRRLGEDVGYTGVRQPQTISSTTGTAYSETRLIDGISYGFPIEGAKISQRISGNDGTLLYENNYVMTSGVLMPV